MEKYLKLNKYLKNKYGERTLKIAVNGGFSCPNRDGTKSHNGCIFCSSAGAGENMFSKACSITKQLDEYFSSYKAQRANLFIIYFQSFTNTYDTLDNLYSKYLSAFSYTVPDVSKKIVGVSIATRPDCVNIEVLKLLKRFQEKYSKDITIELGLQTSNDTIAEIINRCYNTSEFEEKVKLIKSFGFEVVTHIMLGLPSSCDTDVVSTINLLNKLQVDGVKIHCTYVVPNTKLANIYSEGNYKPLTYEEYMEQLGLCISHLAPNIVVHRIKSDPPKDFIAPRWLGDSKKVINSIEKYLEENNIFQGKYVNGDYI